VHLGLSVSSVLPVPFPPSRQRDTRSCSLRQSRYTGPA
jgi:hypothetical protein